MKELSPICSICIANFNGIGLIEACIESVLAQNFGKRVEIIVHDDASTDDSIIVIRSRYPDVKLIASAENVGFCVANNRMAAMAQGEYLLLLNNDAELYPDALRTLLDEANRLETSAILSLPQFDSVNGELVDQGCLLDPFFNPVPNLDRNRHDVAMVIGACLWIPNVLWKELGGFPEWFGSIAEDMYLCGRARLAGCFVRVPAISGYRHYQGKSFGGNRLTQGRLSTTYLRRSLSERNKTYVMILLSPFPQLVLTLPIHLVFLALEGLLIALLKFDKRIWGQIYYPVFQAIWMARSRLSIARNHIREARIIPLSTWLHQFVIFPYKLGILMKYGIPIIK